MGGDGLELVVVGGWRCAGAWGSGATTATTAAAALTVGTCATCLDGYAFLRLAGCFGFVYTFVVAVELFIAVEVVATVEDDGVLVGGLGCACCGWSGTFGAGGTVAVAITAATISAISAVTSVATVGTLTAFASAGLLGKGWEA